MTQWSRALAALVKDPASVSRNYMIVHNCQ